MPRTFFKISPLLLILIFIAGSGCKKDRLSPRDNLSASQEAIRAVLGASDGGMSYNQSLLTSINKMVQEYNTVMKIADSTFSTECNKMIDSAVLYLSSKLFMQTDPEIIVEEITHLIFDEWGIRFNDDRNNVEYLFPHLVLKNKQGSCVGIALLYLLIAEKNATPLYGVRVPGHFYIRYTDGMTSRNIETLRHGEDMSATWYREKYHIRDTSLYDMRNLKIPETAAVIAYNIGTILLQKKRYDSAERFLKKSVSAISEFPEATGNLALVLSAKGHHEDALKMLATLDKKYPGFENITSNSAIVHLRAGNVLRALFLYEQLLENDPNNSDYLYAKGLCLYKTGRNEEAELVLKKASSVAPRRDDIQKLMRELKNR